MRLTALRSRALCARNDGRHTKFGNMFLSRVMRQSIKVQPVLGCPGHLSALTAIGLAVGLIVVPLEAAPRRLVPVPRDDYQSDCQSDRSESRKMSGAAQDRLNLDRLT